MLYVLYCQMTSLHATIITDDKTNFCGTHRAPHLRRIAEFLRASFVYETSLVLLDGQLLDVLESSEWAWQRPNIL